ncbi:MAG: hypothetical protein LBH77_02835 [Tannerella sp.]|jgi:hypothetical protein|nr:hypothetical protein [Tannerella sp.]
MKNLGFNIFITTMTVFCMLFLTACPKEEREPDTLSVAPASFTFSADDTREQVATISTNAPSWKFSGGESWLNIYTKQDDKLYVTAQNYTNTETSRKATITITAGDAMPVTVSVEQTAKEINTLSVNPTSLSFDGNETGEKTATITSNAPSWDATCDASWLRLSQQDKTLKVSVSTKNTGTADRTADVRITAGNAPALSMKVTQTVALYLTVSPTSLSFGVNETNDVKTLTINTNCSSWNVTSSTSWLSATKSGNTLRVRVNSANTGSSSRQAEIKITASGVPDVIVKVTQAESTYLNVTPTSLSFEAKETSTKQVSVSTNASSAWEATASASWVSVTKSGNNAFNVKVTANTSTSARNATITVKADNAPNATVSVTQNGASSGSTPPFGEIARSSYTATGINEKGATVRWSGTIIPVNGTKPYYEITNWANTGYTLYCNYIYGLIVMDLEKTVGNMTNDYLIFRPALYDSRTNIITFYIGNFILKYDKSSKVLDCSVTMEGENGYIVLIAKSKSNDEYQGNVGNMCQNVKLTLTSTSSAPMSGNEETYEVPLDNRKEIRSLPTAPHPETSPKVKNIYKQLR